MAGGRKPGVLGLYGDLSGRRAGVLGGSSEASPLGLGDPGPAPEHASAGLGALLAAGLGFSVGARHYRILATGTGLRTDEERLDERLAAEILAEAANEPGSDLAAVLADLRSSWRSFIVVRVRPRAPAPVSSLEAPPASSAAPPARKAAPVKEGWIEIEVLADAGEPRTGDGYKLKLPDGRVLEGTIGGQGIISLHGIDPGSAELTITNLDGALWSA